MTPQEGTPVPEREDLEKEVPPQTLLAAALHKAVEQKFFFVGHADETYHGDFHVFSRERTGPDEAMKAMVSIAANVLKANAPQLLEDTALLREALEALETLQYPKDDSFHRAYWRKDVARSIAQKLKARLSPKESGGQGRAGG